jgi:hypothetical protein
MQPWQWIAVSVGGAIVVLLLACRPPRRKYGAGYTIAVTPHVPKGRNDETSWADFFDRWLTPLALAMLVAWIIYSLSKR